MPTYEYRCNACEHEFETFQSITAKSLRKCPECGKLKLERLISGGGAVLFKGSGFYETDYRSADYQKAADADKKSSEPKKDAKTETKPDTKAGKASDAKPAKKPDAKPTGSKAKTAP
jgi:putative FmdB family regulatory protein